MIRDTWNDLIVHNPMLIEITRFRRRYLSRSSSAPAQGIVLILAMVCYATLVLIVIQNRQSISPIHLIMFQTGLLTALAPMLLYNAIAGERERRSWDLLLAAPITKPQIVVGKFLGALTGVVVAVLFMLVPVTITTNAYIESHWGTVFVADLVSMTFLMSVCALTILFSARVKRGLMALGATLGALVCGLVVIPSIIGFGTPGNRTYVDVTYMLHPFYVLYRLINLDEYLYSMHQSVYSPMASSVVFSTEQSPPAAWWGVLQALVYLGMTIVLLAWASNTLNFAENEVKFLPQGHKDA